MRAFVQRHTTRQGVLRAVLTGTFLLGCAFVVAAPANQPEKKARKAAGKVHLIIVSDTVPPELADASLADGKNIQSLFEANIPEAQLTVTYFDTKDHPALKKDPNRLKPLVLETLNALAPQADDAVVFYYTGHGAYDLDGHKLDLAGRTPRDLHRREVLAEITSKQIQPRLTVLLTDCCHVFNAAKTTISANKRDSNRPAEISAGFRALFFEVSGVVDVTSSAKNQVSMALGTRGSLFTIALGLELDNVAPKADVTWEKLLKTVAKNAEDIFKKEFPEGVDSRDEGGKPYKQFNHTLHAFSLAVTATGGGGTGASGPVFGAEVRNRPGTLVTDLDEKLPAFKAGLRIGDVVYQIGQTQTLNPQSFSDALDAVTASGREAPVFYLRMVNGPGGVTWEKKTLKIPPSDKYGVGVNPRPGALVVRVVDKTPAAMFGLKPGDVILQLDGRGIKDVQAYDKVLNPAKPPSKIGILRGEAPLTLSR